MAAAHHGGAFAPPPVAKWSPRGGRAAGRRSSRRAERFGRDDAIVLGGTGRGRLDADAPPSTMRSLRRGAPRERRVGLRLPAGAGRLPRALKEVVSADWFRSLSTALVLINMALMCMPYEGQSEERAAWLELGASVITWIFIVEMGLKLVGFGCAGYWADGWNQLDGTIVLSIVDIA